MALSIETNEVELGKQSNNFCSKIDKYKDVLKLDADKVTNFKDGNTYMQFVLDISNETLLHSKSLTEHKVIIIRGHGKEVLSDIPTLNPLPVKLPGVPMVNMHSALTKLAKSCSESPNFTASIGFDLGIWAEVTPAKPEEGKPNLTVKLASGGHPILHASKGIYQGFQLWRDIGDAKGFVLINVSQYADYLDVGALPSTDSIWKYKAIYIHKGELAGKWSEVVTVLVFAG